MNSSTRHVYDAAVQYTHTGVITWDQDGKEPPDAE